MFPYNEEHQQPFSVVKPQVKSQWECISCDVRWLGPRGSVCWACDSMVAVKPYEAIFVPKGSSGGYL